MLKAVCVVCKELVRVASQKLVTVQWVEIQTGSLCSLQFHSDCYVRWYKQTAAQAQRQLEGAQSGPPRRLAALPAPREGVPTGVAGDFLTQEEKRALALLRRKVRTRRAALQGRRPAQPKPPVDERRRRGAGRPVDVADSPSGSPGEPPETSPAPKDGGA